MNNKPSVNFSKVIDLFCGIGGLTNGFIQEGFEVAAGYDIDETCRYAYENNNNSQFINKDVALIEAQEINTLFNEAKVKILVGCAPCQPFSSYNFKNEKTDKWFLLNQFARLIDETNPDIVSMENVSQLLNFKKAAIFTNFVNSLVAKGYHVSYKVVSCQYYGLPQNRKRLVLLASKKAVIELVPPTHSKDNFVTVKDTIYDLPPLAHGQQSKADNLHKCAKLNDLNLKRIRQSIPGGSWKDWDKELQLKCHTKESGQGYVSVYGRMNWDSPAPTITTQCYGLGNGRFGHPEQDRAISLREAALLQSFPKNYSFTAPNALVHTRVLGTHIGNAVPPLLGKIIAQSIKTHISQYYYD
jgi:DNA (cytosine-5)-methyltransferase 1